MGRLRQTKSEDLYKAKRAILRKVTFMKFIETVQALSVLAIALKYTGALDKITALILATLG